MLGLTVQNFVSAATGMAVLVALIRGFARKQATGIGNFWVDLVRSTLYILLPLVAACSRSCSSARAWCRPSTPIRRRSWSNSPSATISRRTARTVSPLKDASGNTVTERASTTEQTIAVGPAASQVAIKQLGTNGGGFFNVNSAHPLENPTPLSNFVEMLAILLIPAALCYTFGRMIGDTRQGWALLAAMVIVLGCAARKRLPDRDRAQSDGRAGGRRFARLQPMPWAPTSRARRCASASPTRCSGRRSRPRPPTAA